MTAQDESRESLQDLNSGEKHVLAKLVRLLVRSDGELSDAEREQIEKVAEKAGADEFWKHLNQASESEDEYEAILKTSESIKAKDAQEMIYGTLYELSIQDGTDGSENDLLDRLAIIWNLKIEDVE